MSQATNQSKNPGPPRWTYILGALAAAGTLTWAIVSRLAQTAPDRPSSVSVSISGTQNAGVGVNNGRMNSIVSAGTPPGQPAPDASAASR